MHLASGLYLQETLTQQEEDVIIAHVTGDDRLITAAQVEGLTVDNPFWHTDLDVYPSP